jgi:NAD(P)-dependent dehydrogenase (short-subunit alcohol dehydrogenase family)
MASQVNPPNPSPSCKYLSKLTNTRVLVLGGSSGIGFCVAEAAVEHGATVTIASSNETKLAKALDRLRATYPDRTEHITSHPCDLSQKDMIESNLDKLLRFVANTGPSDSNNPAIPSQNPAGIDHIVFTAMPAIKVTRVADATIPSIEQPGVVPILGGIMLAKLAPRFLKQSPSSSLTFTSGTNAHKPTNGWTILAAWGSAMEGMVRGLAVELKPIRVNLVSPGAVLTELWNNVPAEIIDDFKKVTTTGTIGRPEDLAEAYLYLMKDQFVTGAIIESNGGRLLV